MSRERIIVEIETLDQAEKVEETIKTGYCEPIAENLLAWIAAEEDIIDSYNKLSLKFADRTELKVAMKKLAEESKNNVSYLQRILDSIEELGAQRDQRLGVIQELLPKAAQKGI
jgi:ferritin-like metal-binding protein YciE